MLKWTFAGCVLCLLAGCANPTTETGYAPRKLGDSQAVQRGYYAQPYSPEAAAALRDKQNESERRKPIP